MFTIRIVNAHKRRDAVIFDVPGAYFNAYIPEDNIILLNLEGGFVDIMRKVISKHKNDVGVENGVKVL